MTDGKIFVEFSDSELKDVLIDISNDLKVKIKSAIVSKESCGALVVLLDNEVQSKWLEFESRVREIFNDYVDISISYKVCPVITIYSARDEKHYDRLKSIYMELTDSYILMED